MEANNKNVLEKKSSWLVGMLGFLRKKQLMVVEARERVANFKLDASYQIVSCNLCLNYSRGKTHFNGIVTVPNALVRVSRLYPAK